ANARDRLHLLTVFEELHAERDCPQLQKALQIGNEPTPVLGHACISRRGFGRQISLGVPICLHVSPSMCDQASEWRRRSSRAVSRRPSRPTALFENIPPAPGAWPRTCRTGGAARGARGPTDRPAGRGSRCLFSN